MWTSRLFWKLLVAFGVVYMASAAILGIVVANQQRSMLMGMIRQRLESNAVLLRSRVEEQHIPQSPPGLQQLVVGLGRQTSTRITIVGGDGRVWADSQVDPSRLGHHGDRPEIVQAARQGSGESTRHSMTLGRRMYFYAVPFHHEGQLQGFVRMAVELDVVDRELARLNRRMILITLAVGAMVAPVSCLAVGHFIRPLIQFNESLKAIAAGDYSRRVQVSSKDELGRLVTAFNAMQEQLQRRVAELQESSDHMATVLSGMVEGVIAVDPQQRVLLANTASRALLEVIPKDVVGRSLLEVVRNREVQRSVLDALQTDAPITREIALTSTPRRVLRVLATRLPGTPCPGVVVVLHDVTELRRLENLRRDFVANVSHELKTPLAAIKAYAETLRLGAIHDAEHNVDFVARIEEHANRLHQLILDLLQLARVETGKEAFEFEEVSLRDAVADCVAHHADAAATAGVELQWSPPSEEVQVWADASGVQTILDNLVTNAIKYTPSGGRVTITWHKLDALAEIDVSDTGIGIAPQDQARVFERFFRVDRARSRELGGTGLGLAIVKHLCQAFGGDVGLTSQLGQGSSFFVRLPLAPFRAGAAAIGRPDELC